MRGGAKKKLEEVLGGTGLSPDPRFRRRFATKAQRRDHEEEEVIIQQQLEQQQRLLQRGVSRSVFAEEHKIRRIAKQGARPTSCSSPKGNAGGFADQHRRDLAPGGDRASSSLDPVLPASHGTTPSRCPIERGIDPLLCHRPDPPRPSGRIGRLSGSEVEKSSKWFRRGRHGKSPRGSRFYLRNAQPYPTRSEAKEAIREQKEESKTKSEASQAKGKGEGWKNSSWNESGGDASRKGKEAKGKGKKGKQKEEQKK